MRPFASVFEPAAEILSDLSEVRGNRRTRRFDRIIHAAQMDDAAAIWRIVGLTIRTCERYALDRDMTEAAALAYSLGNDGGTRRQCYERRNNFVANRADASLASTSCTAFRDENS